jgi:hypothetical protein
VPYGRFVALRRRSSGESNRVARAVIESNDPHNPHQRIGLVARNPVPLTITPSQIEFRIGSIESLPCTRSLRLRFLDAARFSETNIAEPRVDRSYFQSSVKRDPATTSYTIDLTLLNTAPAGNLKFPLEVKDTLGSPVANVWATADIPSLY